MKVAWRKMLAVCAVALAVSPIIAADAMPRSEWHNLVSDCAQNAQTLRETMAKIAPGEQTAFLAEVNEAISKMPGSDEVKCARFYAANSAAVKSAAKGNLPNVLAEVFATVPPEFLTDINERFAKEIFNRTATAGRTYTDEQYTTLVTNAMTVINARCEKSPNAGVRETFAILMFLRASNGTPANLSELLVATMPDAKNRELAANEWIKPAMGDGQEQTYDPMLGFAQAGEEPDRALVTPLIILSASEHMVELLHELAAKESTMETSIEKLVMPPSIAGTPSDIGLTRVPRTGINEKRGHNNNAVESDPYPWQ